MPQSITPTGVEQFFDKDEIIVSKTDLKGRLTYTNRVFMRLAGYNEKELLGQPHNLIRHPDMPRCVFKLLWDTLQSKKEIFAYVVNMCRNGDHYWVFAHVTPSLDGEGNINGYHSNRRVPDRKVLDGTIIPLYKRLLAEEQRHKNTKEGMKSSFKMLVDILEEKGIGYDEFIFSL
ncbi:MAG: chemotaxis protein [Alphaproteobacteria bacterium]|nr:MAG: chemotaxis protein [Alphaproteobacteria bacterium]